MKQQPFSIEYEKFGLGQLDSGAFDEGDVAVEGVCEGFRLTAGPVP